MGLFPEKRWVLETSLTPEECAGRLRLKVRGRFWQTVPVPGKPFFGTVSSSGFAVQFYPTRPGQNYVNPYYVRGVFQTSAGRTIIRAAFGVGKTYSLFVAVMASTFLFVAWLPAYFSFRYPTSPALQAFFGFVFLAILLVTYGGIKGVGRFFEVEGGDPILETVVETLEAEITAISGD